MEVNSIYSYTTSYMTYSIDTYGDAHETLLFAQEEPIYGLLVVSPITLVIGLIEVIGGLVSSIITLPFHYLPDDHLLKQSAQFINLTAALGIILTVSSLSNIITLGYCSWPL